MMCRPVLVSPKTAGRPYSIPGTPYYSIRAGSPQYYFLEDPQIPDVHVKRIRFVTLWSRCPSHDWVVSR